MEELEKGGMKGRGFSMDWRWRMGLVVLGTSWRYWHDTYAWVQGFHTDAQAILHHQRDILEI